MEDFIKLQESLMGHILQEIDLTDNKIVAFDEIKEAMTGLQTLKHPLQKGISTPVLTPLVNKDVPGSPPEPVYTNKIQGDIQGNIIPGFNKNVQKFLFYKIKSAKRTKSFLKWLLPYISTMEEVMAFRRLYRSRKFRLGSGNTFLESTGVNIAFSYNGTIKLVGKRNASALGDVSFKQGMAERSAYLGDPTSTASRGHQSNWVVGGEENEADIIIILAADNRGSMKRLCKLVERKAASASMDLIFTQDGETLPGNLRGHEHFGFKDGISQPGVRGKLSNDPGDYITPRYIADADDRRLYMAKPGQLLNWPGQFLLGEQRQDTEELYDAGTVGNNFPAWAARGSYLVVRRLNQDVPAFWKFATSAAQSLGMSATKFASMLVGRWPSGAPIMRQPNADDPALGADQFANNHFLFDDNTRASSLRLIPGYPGDNFPQATADFLATVCPHFAHIRKMNARDSVTDLGKPEDNLARAILRRGIPFGSPIVGKEAPSDELIKEERGLMFLSYQSSIEDQFEFLQRRWANSSVQPNFGGHDPIIGQEGGNRPGSRARFIDFPTPQGAVRIHFKPEWVTPTGGGYFFAPSISAIKNEFAN